METVAFAVKKAVTKAPLKKKKGIKPFIKRVRRVLSFSNNSPGSGDEDEEADPRHIKIIFPIEDRVPSGALFY